MTQSDPTGMHEWHSGEYVKEWIGSYTNEDRTASLRRIVHLIPFDPDRPISVLDIGGGWGPISALVLEAFPNARVTLHDFSEPMLQEARANLAEHANAMSYYRGDLMSPEWTAGLKGPFDAVVSSLAIHNVRFPDRIHAIYDEIFPLVAAGGCFINLDQVSSGDLVRNANRHAQAMSRRQQVFEETGRWTPLAEAAGGGPGERLHRHARASEEDLKRIAAAEPATLPNQLRWLTDAGFDEVECFGRERGSALIGAFRA